MASDAAPRCDEGLACTVSVTKGQVVARFPLDDAPATWRWNQASTPDSGGEYKWGVTFGICSSTDESLQRQPYSLEVNLFKYPGSAERSGSFSELMSASQGNLWKCESTGCVSQQRLHFSGKLERGHVEVSFGSDPAIDALIAQKPPVAVLAGPGSYCHARVEYK